MKALNKESAELLKEIEGLL